jgi:hypothetical protein
VVVARRSEDPLETARAWAQEYASADAPDAWIAGLALEAKASRTDGGLERWEVRDVDQVLSYLVIHVLVEPDEAGRVVPTLVGLVQWLARSGRVGSDEAEQLVSHLQRRKGVVVEALVDPARWSPSKRMLMAMQARGLDLADPGSLSRAQGWPEGVPLVERGRVLGLQSVAEDAAPSAGDLPTLLRSRLGGLPPVVLAGQDELDAAARATVWWQRERGLCEYVGAGLRVTRRGYLRMADGRELVERLQTGDALEEEVGGRVVRPRSTRDLPTLDLVVEVAVSAGFLDLDGSWLRPGPDAELVEESPAEAVHQALLALISDVGILGHRHASSLTAGVVDEHVPVLLADLYGRPEIVSVAELVADLRGASLDLMEDAGTSAPERARLLGRVQDEVELVLTRLEEFGVLVRTAAARLALTPLGAWSVNQWLALLLEAPVLGGLLDLPAAQMLRRAGDLPEEVANAEVDAWVARHGARELVRALGSCDETGERLAVCALVRLGPSGAGAVEALGSVEGFGELAEVWRAEVLGEQVPGSDDPQRVVRLLAAVLRGWGPREVGEWLPRLSPSPVDFVLAAWRVRLPETVDVLTALAEVHDTRVAKAARRSLFKLRSERG